MQHKSISHAETRQFSEIVLDYLSKSEKLRPFFGAYPEIESFRAMIEAKSSGFKYRDELVNALSNQYASAGLNAGKLLRRLSDNNTFTVTTGHQLSLLTGPLYFIYKIAGAIKLAEQLRKEFPQHDFIPVYWMASEDHDFDEINHLNLFGKRIEWESGQAGAVGRMKLTGVEEVLSEVYEILGDSSNAQEVKDLLNRAFGSPDQNYAQAVRRMVADIFGSERLLIVDGDDPILKSCFVPQMKKDLLERFAEEKVAETSDRLSKHYNLQVTPREINLFYLEEQLRERIVRKEEHFEVLHSGKIFSKSEILTELEAHPERFSPNVVLRPLYQETILPNLAYIGGGGELAYWFQLKAVFEEAGIGFPLLMLRNSVMWVGANELRKADKLGITVGDLFGEQNDLIKSVVKKLSDQELSLADQKEEISAVFDKVAELAEKIDPTLRKMVLADEARAVKSLEVIEKKMIKAEKDKSALSVNQINSLYEKLLPGGGLQERHDNFLEYYLRYGATWLEQVSEALSPLDQSFILIEERD